MAVERLKLNAISGLQQSTALCESDTSTASILAYFQRARCQSERRIAREMEAHGQEGEGEWVQSGELNTVLNTMHIFYILNILFHLVIVWKPRVLVS